MRRISREKREKSRELIRDKIRVERAAKRHESSVAGHDYS